MKRWILILGLISLLTFSIKVHGQSSSTPEMRPFNVSLSIGHGGMHHIFLPALEVKTWRFTARGSRGFAFWNTGLDYEITMLKSNLLQNKLHIPHSSLVVSGVANWQTGNIPLTEFDYTYRKHFQLLAGINNYCSPRTVISIKAGMRYSESHYNSPLPDQPSATSTELSPWFEISYSLSLFKNY